MSKIKIISPQQVRDANMFGPVYHGTTNENMKEILKSGFKIFVGNERDGNISNGYVGDTNYAWGAPAPIHHLGFGIYFTTRKAIAKRYGHGSTPKHPFYLTEHPYEINFGSPNTMMKWWVDNGYDIELAKKDRLAATKKLTNELKKKHKAIWFKGQGLHTLLDGDQVVVFDQSIIRGVDPTLSKDMEIGSKVERFQEWVYNGERGEKRDQSKWELKPLDPPRRGVITHIRPINEDFQSFHPLGAKEFVEIKYDQKGREMNAYKSELRPYNAKRAIKSKFSFESAFALSESAGDFSLDFPEFKKWFKGSKVVDADGEPLMVYHGSGTEIKKFDPRFMELGNERIGSGFYFTTSKDQANGYSTTRTSPDQAKPGGEDNPTIHGVYLNIKKPLDENKVGNLTYKQVKDIIQQSPDLENALENFGDVEFEGRANVLNQAVQSYVGNSVEILKRLILLSNDFYRGHAERFNHVVRSVLGYDGVHSRFDDSDHWVAWFPDQIWIAKHESVKRESIMFNVKPLMESAILRAARTLTEDNVRQTLIHVAPWSVWKKIKKEGLKAHGGGNRGIYCDKPDEARIYLFEDANTAEDAMMAWMLDLPQWEEEMKAAFIEVDVSGLDVIADPEIAGSYYVTQDIPASRIKLRSKEELGESVLVEKKEAAYKHAVAMLDMPKEVADKVKDWQKENIDEGDVYTSEEDSSLGLEDEIHATILYGIRNEDLDKVKDLVEAFGPIEIELDGLMIFDNADNDRPYEVLNIKVKSKGLQRLHKLLKDNVKNEQKWPDYKPHVCIGYLKKGVGEKYKDLDPPFDGDKFTFDAFVFKSGGEPGDRFKRKIKLGSKDEKLSEAVVSLSVLRLQKDIEEMLEKSFEDLAKLVEFEEDESEDLRLSVSLDEHPAFQRNAHDKDHRLGRALREIAKKHGRKILPEGNDTILMTKAGVG